jgi:hypothetical protein
LWRDTAAVLLVGASIALIAIAVLPGLGQTPQQAVLDATGTPVFGIASLAPASTVPPSESAEQSPSPTAAASPSATLAPSPSSSPTATPTARPTATATARPTATATAQPTVTPRPTATPRQSAKPTPTPTPTVASPVILGFTADVLGGEAPLLVNFSGAFTGGDEWVLNFGDGRAIKGSTSPVKGTNTYVEAGTYDAVLSVSNEGGTVTRALPIVVSAPSPSPSP